jgi:four helix bundle protein
MGTITNFEDLEAWKKAREITMAIYKITSDGDFGSDFSLKDQIRRASVAIMANIAEGYERGGNKEFIHFLSMAKGSAGEVRSLLYVALDAGLIHDNDYEQLMTIVLETSRLISGLMRYLKESDHKGHKYK